MESEKEFDIELMSLDKAISLESFLEYSALANDSRIKKFCLQSGMIDMLPEVTDHLNLACQVNYPDGLGSRSAKVFEAGYAINSGCKTVDVVINHIDLQRGKWDRIHRECQEVSTLCKEKGAAFRVVIEYRLQPTAIWKAFFTMLCDVNCEGIITSTGRMADDFVENILFCHSMSSQFPIPIIPCGYTFSPAQVEKFLKVGVTCFRITSLNAAKSILDIS